jgi:hypothetical protein
MKENKFNSLLIYIVTLVLANTNTSMAAILTLYSNSSTLQNFTWTSYESSPNSFGVTKIASFYSSEKSYFLVPSAGNINVSYQNQPNIFLLLSDLTAWGGIANSNYNYLPGGPGYGTPNFVIHGSINLTYPNNENITCSNLAIAEFSVQATQLIVRNPWVIAQNGQFTASGGYAPTDPSLCLSSLACTNTATGESTTLGLTPPSIEDSYFTLQDGS